VDFTINRTDLFNYHNLFDIKFETGEYYVYTLPYYRAVYTGRHIFPDGNLIYLIDRELFVKLKSMQVYDKPECRSYVEQHIDSKLMNHIDSDEFIFIGDSANYVGSLPSAVMQALVKYTG
jgi:hypothetical protein